MSLKIAPNTYYVYRINGLVEIDVTKIKQGEIFFYCGLVSSANCEKFFVFGLKDNLYTKPLETYYDMIGGISMTPKLIESKLIEYKKLNS